MDYVPEILHNLGVANFELVAMLDSPLWVDIDPITGPSGSIMPLMEQTQIILGFLNATNRLGPTCQTSYPEDEWWKCLFGEFRLPFVTTPYILNAAQFDNFQVPYNEGANPPYDAAQLAYAESFQQAVLTALAPVPTAAQAQSGVFSSACFHHCVTQETDYWGIKVDNQSFRDVSADWYFRSDYPIRVVERCTGFRCGECRSHRTDRDAPPDPKHVRVRLFRGWGGDMQPAARFKSALIVRCASHVCCFLFAPTFLVRSAVLCRRGSCRPRRRLP